jgi:WD repeat-containing protein 26
VRRVGTADPNRLSATSSTAALSTERPSPVRASRRKRHRLESEASDDEALPAGQGNATDGHQSRPALPKPKRRRRASPENIESMRGDGRTSVPKGSAPQSPSSPHHSLSNGSSNGHPSPTMAKFTNGHSSNGAGIKGMESNGFGVSGSHKHSNGTSSGPKELPPIWEGHLRAEVTRILVQSLTELGYHNTARTLSLESGYQVEGSLVSAFRNCVLAGNWAETERLLLGDWTKDVTSAKNDDLTHGGLPLVPGSNKKELVFWIRQQKYLELLEKRDLSSALVVLRQELTPLHQDSDRLHALGG